MFKYEEGGTMNSNSTLPNGWRLRRFSLFWQYFAYIDTAEYLADRLFIKHCVRIKFLQEYSQQDSSYCIVFARCRKKDFDYATAALHELPNKMLICGHSDYPEVCVELLRKMEEGRRKLHQGEESNNEAKYLT